MTIKRAVVLACVGNVDYTRFKDVCAVDAYVVAVELAVKQCLAKLKREAIKLPELAATFLASYSHPSPKINQHLEVLNELFDKAEMLESIHAMLVSGFSSMPKAIPLIQRVQALIVFTRSRVDKALLAMSRGVEKHQPAFFAACVNGVVQRVAELPAHEQLIPISMMRVITNPDTGDTKGTQFSVYLCFRGMTDATGYRHDKFHIVLSCVVDTFGKFTMNYSLQPTMRLPGKFRSTDIFTSVSNCMTGIGVRLNEEGF